jgi:hypothetical protein
VYACMAPPAKKEIRSPGVIQQPGGGVARGGNAVGSNARSTGPSAGPRAPAKTKSEVSIESITSPRDAASGLPSGRRKQPQ